MHNNTSPSVCFYFQVHQPYRLRDVRFHEIGAESELFDDELNEQIFRKVAEKCYLPANETFLRMLKNNPDWRIAFSLSGVFLEQAIAYGPDVLASFQELVRTGQVEILSETYGHTLSSLYSLREFREQVEVHRSMVESLFGVRPTVFRNTELIYNNNIACYARLLGFDGIVAEGTDRHLQGRSPNYVYHAPSFWPHESWHEHLNGSKDTGEAIAVLLKQYQLSDDIAFRFSASARSDQPLTAETFAHWVRSSGGDVVNLFMDYETFGEHQWEDTGIFRFLEALPEAFAREGIRTVTPSQVVQQWNEQGKQGDTYDAHDITSWADSERDLSAWRGNRIQESSLAAIYAMEEAVRATNDPELLRLWRRLQTSDHFYYMSTKFWQDGDVHKYFSPYDSPYEAYRRFSHALWDLRSRLEQYQDLPSS